MSESEHPVEALEHGHVSLTQSIDKLKSERDALREQGASRAALLDTLETISESLFEHFAREEEGLFPFLLERLPDRKDDIDEMLQAHDRICGAASRLVSKLRITEGTQDPQLLESLLDRFAETYTQHSQREILFLRSVNEQLSADERKSLSKLLRAL